MLSIIYYALLRLHMGVLRLIIYFIIVVGMGFDIGIGDPETTARHSLPCYWLTLVLL